MADRTIPQALQQAAAHHQASRLPEAEAIYHEILARDPSCVGAMHGLGIIALQVGRYEVAANYVGRAAALAPHDSAIHFLLGEACRGLNHLDAAVASYRQAIALQPNHPDALNNLGSVLTTQGKVDDAIASFRQALALRPGSAEVHNNLGNALVAQGRPEEELSLQRGQ
ncbi:MAG: tetratricopeptide repeat protein [Verrucomicrobia bacterium]|nr:tetratricopeptide repeat protein [Verrucomicrobiota bacterium]